MISIHALLAESDPANQTNLPGKISISIHALLAESDRAESDQRHSPDISIHALLAESDRVPETLVPRQYQFLSTLSLRRATIRHKREKPRQTNFYPRSPCGERPVTTVVVGPSRDFYPRSPCGERQRAEHHANSQQEFLSTLSLRRATASDISARRGASISIHALLAESDRTNHVKRQKEIKFLSTLSLRRATN